MISSLKSLSMSRTGWLIPIVFLMLLPIMAVGIVRVPSLHIIVLAACLLGIVTVPILHSRQIDWFSPWNWLFYSAILGVFLRSIYIAFDIPNRARIQQVFLRGESKEFLLMPMVVVLIGMSVMTLGYLAGPGVSRKISFRVFQSDRWNEKRFLFSVLILQLLAWVGIYFFITKTSGGLSAGISLENISALRGVSRYLSEYRAHGYLRWMATLSNLICYLIASKAISSRRLCFRDLVLFLFSLSTSLFFYVYVSSRGPAISLLIDLFAISYYLHDRKLNLVGLIPTGIFALLLTKVLTLLRLGYGFAESIQQGLDLTGLIEPIVLTLTGLDVSKTAHIMAAIPQRLDYQWGQTLITFLFAWIPRGFWPGKLVVNIDNILGRVVFGATAYGSGGLPPGIIAEMYWNFSFPGIIAGCFAVGYLLKIVYVNFEAYSSNRNIVLLYAASFMHLGSALVGSSFAPIVIGFLLSFIPLYVVLHVITQPKVVANSITT